MRGFGVSVLGFLGLRGTRRVSSYLNVFLELFFGVPHVFAVLDSLLFGRCFLPVDVVHGVDVGLQLPLLLLDGSVTRCLVFQKP